MAMLEVKDLEVYYGVICALKGISFHVNEGEIVSLIGANGAGKTTTMQSVIGLLPKKAGSVIFNGTDITKTPCHKIVHAGMTQVPEGRRIFQELTVYENLMINLRPSNIKLRDRMIRIVRDITGEDYDTSEQLLEANEFNIRRAVEAHAKNA